MEYKGFLTHSGFIVPMITLQMIFGARYKEFLRKLIVTYTPKVGPPVYAALYKETTYGGIPCLLLPRTLMRSLSGRLLTSVDNMLSPPVTIRAQLYLKLFDNQQLIIDYLCTNIFTAARLADGTATGILNLLAGMGKTFVAAAMIARLNLRTLYIVPTRPLAVQAVKDIRACLYDDTRPEAQPAEQVLVGLGKPGRKRGDPASIVKNQAVTVMVINSALKRPVEFFKGYSFVILDEVHTYCSDQRRQIFGKACARAMLGMSATTEDRQDGFDIIAHKELAFDQIVRADDIPGFTYEEVEFDCRAKVIYYSGPESHTRNLKHAATDTLFVHYMYNQYIDDPYRTQLAVTELIQLYDWTGLNAEGNVTRHHIYVFAEEVDILRKALEHMTAGLRARQREDIVAEFAVDFGLEMFTGGLKDNEIAIITGRGRVLFSTYPFAGTGVSITKMTAMLFLTPRKAKMKQILARILRRGSDITIPRILVDIVDSKTALRCQAAQRKLTYDFYGFRIENHKVRYTDITLPVK